MQTRFSWGGRLHVSTARQYCETKLILAGRWLLFTSLIRGGLLFVPALIIFLLRISQLRFQPRSSLSPFRGFLTLLVDPGTYQVTVCYFFSAWVFSEIHIYSAPHEADLGWVANGELYERLRLNEKVVYLRSHAFIVASVQAFLHLKHDYSCIRLPVHAIDDVNASLEKESKHTRAKLEKLFPQICRSVLGRALSSAVLGPFMYLPIRPWAWAWSLSFARLVWNIPEDNEPDIIPPFHWTLLLRTVLQGFLLYGLWESCNTLFSVFVAQKPIKKVLAPQESVKKDKPLSAGSQDPNGTLINGLRAQKAPVRSYALWELDLIVRHFEERRKSILTEIDRNGDSAWSQVLKSCLGTVNEVSTRITGPTMVKPQQISPESMEALPKIAPPLKSGLVAEPSSPSNAFTSFINVQARKAGSAPPGEQLDLSPHLRKFVGDARDSILTKEQQQMLTKEQLEASAHTFLSRLLRLTVPTTVFLGAFQPGQFFQETYARRLSSTLFGRSFNDKTNILRAINVLTSLLIASVTEDTYGVVSKNVPEIWRSFVKTVDGIEMLLKSNRTHWTDVEFSESRKRNEDIDELLLHLRVALKKLVDTFSSEASARGLTPADIKNGRRIASASRL